MAELTQAYRLLTDYAANVQRGRGAAERRGRGEHPNTPAPLLPCTFGREAVDRTLLIAIRRQEIVT